MAGDEKTEKATPKKREEARKEGDVLQSKEIVIAVSVLGIFVAMRLFIGFMAEAVLAYSSSVFSKIGTFQVNQDNYLTVFTDVITIAVMTIGPICAVALLLGIIPTVAQTRGLFTAKALQPKFSRLNPLSGIKKLFSLQSVVGIVKGLLEVIVIGYVIYNEVAERIPIFIGLMDAGIMQAAAYTMVSIYDLVMLICILLVFVAAADYLFQWWQFEKKLKMSKQEVKEEYKQTEGDPQIKGKIKQRQRQMAMARMMQEVPKADVVIRNPTHYAVALKYDQDANRAPQVVAKGKDYIALRIVKIAEENDVYCIEDPPLARTLYSTVDLGREIPVELYNAVAEVLTVVYKAKNKTLHA